MASGLPPRGLVLGSLTVLCWASAFPAIRIAVRGYTPVEIAFLRALSATLVLGGIGNAAMAAFASHRWDAPVLALVAAAVPSTALTVWLAMNFTGATTFTSQTGATREVEVALKPLVLASSAGFFLGVVRIVWNLVA